LESAQLLTNGVGVFWTFSLFFNIVSPLHITSYEKEGYGTTERLGGQGTDRQVMGSGLLERTGFSPHSLLLRW